MLLLEIINGFRLIDDKWPPQRSDMVNHPDGNSYYDETLGSVRHKLNLTLANGFNVQGSTLRQNTRSQ